jgi:hypothetical protein
MLTEDELSELESDGLRSHPGRARLCTKPVAPDRQDREHDSAVGVSASSPTVEC